MDTKKILADLYAERKRLDVAISALEALNTNTTTVSPAPSTTHAKTSRKSTAKKRVLSPEARKRMADAAKERWAKQKKAAGAAAPATKPAKKAVK